ncbi:MAG: hypothetical protein J6W46_09050, partial [Spirochaetaceae bacterium]|nr:hypothetical protein [Spirochaetaceae bacterium]
MDSYINQIQISGLKKNLKKNYEFSFIFMEDFDLVEGAPYTSFKTRTDGFIRGRKFDAILASGNSAFRFILNYKDEIAGDRPIVFIGVSDTELIREGMYYETVTGIKDVIYFDENVLLSKRLFPNSKAIYLITDNSDVGIIGTELFRNLHIRFKDKQGNILPTLEEYGGDVEAYKKYLKDNQAGIAYFECYMPIPNATIERLMT